MHIKATIHVVKDKGAVALYNRSELVSWSKNLLNKLTIELYCEFLS
jgi:hypothetical protein